MHLANLMQLRYTPFSGAQPKMQVGKALGINGSCHPADCPSPSEDVHFYKIGGICAVSFSDQLDRLAVRSPFL